MTHPQHNPPAAEYVAEQSKEPASREGDRDGGALGVSIMGKKYTAWLIELQTKDGPMWLFDDTEAPRLFSWTRDASEAIHFSRKKDAESLIACNHIGHGLYQDGERAKIFASEHSWPEGP